jgi:hypothetical protein
VEPSSIPVPAFTWTDVNTRLPEAEETVLVRCLGYKDKPGPVLAGYYPARTLRAGDDNTDDDYDEVMGESWARAGFYEHSQRADNDGELGPVEGKITHWMRLDFSIPEPGT